MYNLVKLSHAPNAIHAEKTGRTFTDAPAANEYEHNKDSAEQITYVAAVGGKKVEFGDVDADSVNPDYVAMLDALQILGVDAVSACRFASKMSKTLPPTFLKLYGRGRMNELAN